MDCHKILVRLAEIRKAACRAERSIGRGDNLQCERLIDLIGVHTQAIRNEMRGIKGQRE